MKKSSQPLILIVIAVVALGAWLLTRNRVPGKSEDANVLLSNGISSSFSTGTKVSATLPSPKPSSLSSVIDSTEKISPKELFFGFKLEERGGKIYSARSGKRSLAYLKGRNQAETARLFLDMLLKSQGLSSLQYVEGAPSRVGDSTQYFFTQTKEGVPLFPITGVSLLIEGSEALVGMDADYVENLEVGGARPNSIPGGQTLVIHHEEYNERVKGTYAYREIKDGIETVTNASNGAIILKRSRRDH